jgi:hypothetical protein
MIFFLREIAPDFTILKKGIFTQKHSLMFETFFFQNENIFREMTSDLRNLTK